MKKAELYGREELCKLLRSGDPLTRESGRLVAPVARERGVPDKVLLLVSEPRP